MERIIDGQRVWFGIPSAGRSANILTMERHAGATTWYVPIEQHPMYKHAGASRLRPGSSNGVSAARNSILDDAFENGFEYALMSDDDYLGKAHIMRLKLGRLHPLAITLLDALPILMERLRATPFHIAGVPSEHEPAAREGRTAYRYALPGALLLIKKTDLRFDETLYCMEDSDYSFQHMKKYGGTVRCDDLRLGYHFALRDGFAQGGYQVGRTPDVLTSTYQRLQRRWPGVLFKYPNGMAYYRTDGLLPSPRRAEPFPQE